ncbi:hypothetical protein HY523_00120 [Candidatus Berkelbacteria bacterium]|nr:hypothetical protein [Candidatus Berkelbacteria bacterium]
MTSVKPITGPQVGLLSSKLMQAGIDGDAFELLLESNNHQGVVDLINGLLGKANPLLSGDWLDRMVTAEAQALKVFFGQEIDMRFYHEALKSAGLEKMQLWLALGHSPYYLPPAELTREIELPGWKVRPNEFFWKNLADGNFYRLVAGALVKVEKAQLPGQVLLLDNRPKPQYRNGKQMWHKDSTFLGPVIEQLREDKLLATYDHGSQTSRFGASANEVQQHIRPAAAALLGLSLDQVSLEPTLVANLIPQIHRKSARAKDGSTNTWVWYEEYFENAARRVLGGDSGYGGLAGVDWGSASYAYDCVSFRLQGVLATQTLVA